MCVLFVNIRNRCIIVWKNLWNFWISQPSKVTIRTLNLPIIFSTYMNDKLMCLKFVLTRCVLFSFFHRQCFFNFFFHSFTFTGWRKKMKDIVLMCKMLSVIVFLFHIFAFYSFSSNHKCNSNMIAIIIIFLLRTV